MKTKTINLYSFRELSEEAQDKVLMSRANDLASIDWTEEEYIPDYIQKALEVCKKTDITSELGKYILARNIFYFDETDLINELDEDDEIYTQDGEIF